MKLKFFLFSLLFSIHALADSAESLQKSSNSYPLDSVIWPNNAIPVCWEDINVNPAMQASVREVVALTWEASSQVTFTGWNQCPQSFNGIRINVEDVRPHVDYFGRILARKVNGMTLNFTYNNWAKNTWQCCC